MNERADRAVVRVAIAGINGRMGKASGRAVLQSPHCKLVAAFGRQGASYVGQDIGELVGVSDGSKTGILVSNGFPESLSGEPPDVLLDFTRAEASFENAKSALERGIRPVIGTSGLSTQRIEELSEIASQEKLGAMIVPNFSVGAVLMMEFARQAAGMFDHVEIVEMHHNKKVDAPSGTAMHTVDKIASLDRKFNLRLVDEKEILPGARGAAHASGVRVHSLRLPGLISHQEVIFAGNGELFSIKHESFNADCFVRGILLSLQAVMELDQMVVGLERVLPGLAAV